MPTLEASVGPSRPVSFPRWWKLLLMCFVLRCHHQAATRRMWPLSTWNVAGATELVILFHFN